MKCQDNTEDKITSISHVNKLLISENLCGKTVHYMNLTEEPYAGIESGQKIVEVRLFDSKRKHLKVGDIIVFSRFSESRQSCVTEVIGLDCYDSFQQLFISHSPDSAGFKGLSAENAAECMYRYYTKGQEKENVVLAISIKLLTE